MDIIAHAKYIRMSPRRIRIIADVIRGLPVARAEAQLFAIPRPMTTGVLQKLLHSAVANAEQNFDCVRENLYIKTIQVGEGAMLKRSRPRAFGRATTIRKRSAHITIVLGEREEGKRGGRARRETTRAEHTKPVTTKAHDHGKEQKNLKQAPGTSESHAPAATIPGRTATRHHVEGTKDYGHAREKSKGFLKRLFNRKSGSG